MSTVAASTLWSLAAAAATIAGLLLTLWAAPFVRRSSILIVSFAAGTVLTTALLALLPEAIDLTPSALPLVLLGMAAFFLLESCITFHACAEGDHCEAHVIGPVSAVGIGIHSLLDGIAIGTGFAVSPELGLLTAITVILHELPEGIFTPALLIHSGSSRQTAIVATVLVALATPVGAIGAAVVLPAASGEILGALLALTAGSFLYVAASDLVPETHRARSPWGVALFLLGIAFAGGLMVIEGGLPGRSVDVEETQEATPIGV